MATLSQADWEKVLQSIMRIERRFGNEQKNAISARRAELREFIEKFAATELEKDLGSEA